MGLKSTAQKVKHQLFLGRKALGRAGDRVRDTAWYPLLNSTRSDSFDHGRFGEGDGQYPLDYFLHRGPEPAATEPLPAPSRIFAVWAGDNALTPNRAAGLDSIRKSQSPEVEVVLITPDNLSDWQVDSSPIHPAYQHLSLNHRSDYLRCYLLHHHGGGYTDIKRTSSDWSGLFRSINDDPDAWVLGYPEQSSREAAYMDSPLGREIRRRYAALAGNGAFICKPETPLTADWFDEVQSRMDYYGRALERNPATDPFGQNPGYPVPWTMLQAQVFQPLQLKYASHIMLNPAIRPSMQDHR